MTATSERRTKRDTAVTRRARPKRPRPPKDPEGRMAVMDHLRELRRRIVWALIFIAIGAVVGWIIYPHTLDFLEHPYCEVPTKFRQTNFGNGNDVCALTYHGALDGFTTRLKVSAISGAVFTAPFWLYQIWAFITPGLRKNERRYTLTFVLASTGLFAAGMSLAYLVLQQGLRILLEQAGAGTVAQLTVNDYISFVTLMMVVFGAAFELPLLVVMANLAGALKAKWLVKSQRVAIFLIFLFAAVATPSTDPFTMCAMAIPLVVLFEAAVLFSVVHDRRKAKRKELERAQAAAAGEILDDDTPSRVDPLPVRLENRGSWSDVT